jgi:CTP synthase
VLELPRDRHPFFLATQAHPELTSRPLRPQPMFIGLVRAALAQTGVSPESLHEPAARVLSPSDSLGATTAQT